MNIQDNCSDVPEQSTESNYGLLLSKKYRIKISENYSKFVYKKFFKKIRVWCSNYEYKNQEM